MMYRFFGDAGGDAGRSVSIVGDVDGDGLDDLLIAAPRTGDDGAAYLATAAALPLADAADGVADGRVALSALAGLAGSYRLHGIYSPEFINVFPVREHELVGYTNAFAPAGDVDGDGLADFVLGAYVADGGGQDSGEAYLVTAAGLAAADLRDGVADGSIRVANVAGMSGSYRLLGAQPGDLAGWAVGSPGDVDGDGLSDLIFGVPFADVGGADAGVAHLVAVADLAAADALDGTVDGIASLGAFDGLAGSWRIVGDAAGDHLGFSIAGVGDLDGDGLADLAVMAPGGDGRLARSYLVTAAQLAAVDVADGLADHVLDAAHIAAAASSWRFLGYDYPSYSGQSIAGGGDFDGDGTPDLLFGQKWESAGLRVDSPASWTNGSVYLASGADLSAADGGDGNTDGTIDLGNVEAFGGGYRFLGYFNGDNAGVDVAFAGDVDGDGLDDILIGASRAEAGGLIRGEAYLILASQLAAMDEADGLADHRIILSEVKEQPGSYAFWGVANGDAAGWSISGAGDVDGDGLADILVGAPEADGGGGGSGEAYLLPAADLFLADLADGRIDGVIRLANAKPASTFPVAVDDAGEGFSTGAIGSFITANVLANDSSPEGVGLTIAGLDLTGTEGTVVENRDGTFLYIPSAAHADLAPGEIATDSFDYYLVDSFGGNDKGTVTITIEGVSDAPSFGPSLIFQDHFQRADGAPGDPWSTPDETAVIVDGRLKVSSASSQIDALAAAFDDDPTIADFVLDVLVRPGDGTVRDAAASIAFRTQDFDRVGDALIGSGYAIDLATSFPDGVVGYGPIRHVTLFRAADGVVETLAEVDISDQFAPFVVSIVGEGDRISVAIDGELVLSHVDASPDAPLHGGFSLHALQRETVYFDDVTLYSGRAEGSPYHVLENAPVGTLVGTITAVDPDGEALVYTLAGGDDVDGDGTGPFAIDAATGRLTVADPDDLDYETTDALEVQVTATDPGGLSDTRTIRVELVDVAEAGNDRPTLEVDAVQASTPEGTLNGTFVAAVQATDPDPGDVVTFSIAAGADDVDGDGTPAFAIDAAGTLTVADTDDLDFETTPVFTLQIAATDGDGLSDTAELTVALIDMNDVIGTEGADELSGAGGRDLVMGLGGDDVLTPTAGEDILRGGDGIDKIRGFSLYGWTLTDDRLVGRTVDVLDGIERAELSGYRTIDASGFTRGVVTLRSEAGTGTLISPDVAGLGYGWQDEVNKLIGGYGDDRLFGGAGRDMLLASFGPGFVLGDGTLKGSGRDVSFSGVEGARLVAGDGDGRIDASGFRGERTFLDGAAGDDTLIGGAALDTVTSVNATSYVLDDDRLIGNGTDTLVAMDAAQLIGTTGDDAFDVAASTARSIEMIGRDGDDTFVGGDRAAEWVREKADVDFTLTATQLIGQGTDTLTGIDYVRLIGGESANTFDVSAFDGIRTFIHPEGGDDTVIGRASGIDRVVMHADVDLTLTDDRLTGRGEVTLRDVDEATLHVLGEGRTLDASAFTRGPVFLVGGAGDDVLRGGASSDQLTGGAGDDQLFGGKGWDMVVQEGDADMVLTDATLTGAGVDALDSIERAHLTGGLGDNTLDASAFTGRMVILEGGWGDDQLIGRAGGADAVMAQADVDFVLTDATLTGLGTDALTDIDEARLYGWSGSNTFDASAFTRGPVRIYAGAGADVLIGGQGADLLDGGEGADVFWLLDPSLAADELIFVPGQDVLRLDAAGFGDLPTGALAAERFIDDGSAPTSGDAALLYDAATGALRYDADGDGAGDAILIAMLRDAPALAASDIVVEAWLA